MTVRGHTIFRKRKPRRVINLALQGGGAHGAFTWGVLDRLLREPGLEIGWISGTSAGAVNAVAVANGLAAGGPESAIDTLHAVWHGVVDAQVPDLAKLNPFMTGVVRSAASMGAVLSPYEFNPLKFDPLRKLLTQTIDFDRIRNLKPCELLIAATDVATGRARIFSTAELTVDVVLASACLPLLHHAVVIDGRAYWDGGFSANPDLITLGTASPHLDTLIVQINPVEVAAVPKTLRDISDRAETLMFNQGYLRDLAEIARAKALPDSRFLKTSEAHVARLHRHRFHRILADRHTTPLDRESKIRPTGDLISYLHEAGRGEAQRWLEKHGAAIGHRDTMVWD
ncbi:MAG: patatin-like phospholipase family protein [Hyphomicrobiaceae bacterium]